MRGQVLFCCYLIEHHNIQQILIWATCKIKGHVETMPIFTWNNKKIMRNGVFCDLSKATKKCLMQLNILNCIEHFLIALHKLQQTQFFIMKILNFSKVQY